MKADLSRIFAADSSGNITAALPGVATGEHYIAVRTDLKNNIQILPARLVAGHG